MKYNDRREKSWETGEEILGQQIYRQSAIRRHVFTMTELRANENRRLTGDAQFIGEPNLNQVLHRKLGVVSLMTQIDLRFPKEAHWS